MLTACNTMSGSEKLYHVYLANVTVLDECVFEHKHKCTDDEMVAIAFLARLNPCVSGQDCDIADCIYGHHCPSVNLDGRAPICNAYSCKFYLEDHPPNTRIKHPRKNSDEDGYHK
jgi:hypothetical protein